MPKHKIAKSYRFLLKGCCSLFCVLFISSSLFAQYKLTVRLKSIPYSHNNALVFIAGSFNGWDPANSAYKFSPAGNTAFIELKNLTAGNYQFKFTRGGWDMVECTAEGGNVENHSVQLTADTTVEYAIAGWMDDFVAPKKHTASSSVHILDSAFYMPQLNRSRHIWIYLPPGYKKSRKHYPVLYMHDGQNLFDELASGYGEWGVDECLDSLIENGKPPCIVIGIDNGLDKRMSEYNPYDFTWKRDTTSIHFLPEGDAYLDFISKTLKPYVDKHYRTLSSKENTIIAGSSMGGLISYYAVLKYPDTFGKAGIFSPAFWTASGINNLTDSLDGSLKGKYFFYMGGKEDDDDLNRMIAIKEKVGKNSSAIVYSVVDPNGKHNEESWRKWFAEFYNFIMADGYNVSTSSD